ncbi:uncharacterized protein LOC110247732 [Exaiptasia diaphana]|uniref:CYTH domain-containing protein n=1 Tax=Exaiptasia diaphana TaxID=2652724 RepID=A0A913XU97_EXADI|nr:uncharacterized protein LOC110247732 [Exaiptasia diaphana]
MPSNVEIKARVHDLLELKARAKTLSGDTGTIIEQEDTFFDVPNGRLKLRCLKGRPSQLIYYERPDASGPKLSNYYIAETNQPKEMVVTLKHALGIKGVVKKKRVLYLIGQTRVHVDQVEGLGDFMELEVVLEEGQTTEYGQQIADVLMKKLGIDKGDLVTGAYMDLILAKNNDQ